MSQIYITSEQPFADESISSFYKKLEKRNNFPNLRNGNYDNGPNNNLIPEFASLTQLFPEDTFKLWLFYDDFGKLYTVKLKGLCLIEESRREIDQIKIGESKEEAILKNKFFHSNNDITEFILGEPRDLEDTYCVRVSVDNPTKFKKDKTKIKKKFKELCKTNNFEFSNVGTPIKDSNFPYEKFLETYFNLLHDLSKHFPEHTFKSWIVFDTYGQIIKIEVKNDEKLSEFSDKYSPFNLDNEAEIHPYLNNDSLIINNEITDTLNDKLSKLRSSSSLNRKRLSKF